MVLSIGTPVYERLPQSSGIKKGYVDITFDSSYAAGGEAIVYSDIPGLDVSLVGMHQIAANAKTYTANYDSTAGKIWVDAVGAEVAGSVDLSGVVIRFSFLGY
jgi:hypothetical protein